MDELQTQKIHFLDRIVSHVKTIQTGNRDLKQKLDSIVYYYFYKNDKEWHPADLDYFIYDENGRITEFYYNEWDGQSEQWADYEKDEYTYNDEVMTQILIYLWDGMNENWNYKNKMTFVYDNGLMTEIIIYFWNTEIDNWSFSSKYEISYNEDGTMAEAYYYEWIMGTEQWIPVGKRELTYEGGLLVTDIYSSWNNNDWVYSEKYVYSYEGNDVEIEIDYEWNSNQAEWYEDEKYEYYYDDQQNLSEVIYYQKLNNVRDWALDGKEVCTYNNAYNYNDLLLPVFYLEFFANYPSLYFRHMLTNYTEYDWLAYQETWIEDYKEELYYSDITVSGMTDVPSSDVLLAFPNPAKDRITVNLPDHAGDFIVNIYDNLGRLRLSEKISDNGILNVGKLNRGLYLYMIEADGVTYNGKFILK
jgi:hypothetical protein